jgi:uncharacterized repeat protein (TIGR02543 family)
MRRFNAKMLAVMMSAVFSLAVMIAGVVMVLPGKPFNAASAGDGTKDNPYSLIDINNNWADGMPGIKAHNYYTLWGKTFLCTKVSGTQGAAGAKAAFWLAEPLFIARWSHDSEDRNTYDENTYIRQLLNLDVEDITVEMDDGNPEDPGTREAWDTLRGKIQTNKYVLSGFQSDLNSTDKGSSYAVSVSYPDDDKIYLPSYYELYTSTGYWGMSAEENAYSTTPVVGRLGIKPTAALMSPAWTRTPSTYGSEFACYLSPDGSLNVAAGVQAGLPVRPAVNIDLSNYNYEYNLNGGSGGNAPTGPQSGNSVTLASAPTKQYYTFAGWKINTDTALKQPGAKITLTQNTTITAQWTPITPAWQTEPRANPNITAYTAAAQALFDPLYTPAAVSGTGTVSYTTISAPADITWTNGLPYGTTAGTYVIDAKVAGASTLTTRITATISKLNQTVTGITLAGWTYGQTASTPQITGAGGKKESAAETWEYTSASGMANWSETVPANAGDYKVRLTLAATANYNPAGPFESTFAIAKASQGVTDIAMSGFIYGDSPSVPEIIGTKYDNAAETWEYSAGNTQNNWSAAKVLTAGTHGVRLTVQQTDNYTASEVFTKTYTVQKAALTVKANDKTKTYGEGDPTTNMISVTGAKNGETGTQLYEGSVTFTYTLDGGTGSGATRSAGTWTITPSGLTPNDNYTITYSAGTLTVNAADSAFVQIPQPAAPTYNGQPQSLIAAAGTTNDGTVQYSLNNTDWNTAIPTATPVGNYTVYYKIVGDGNHNDNAGSSVSAAIQKADSSFTQTPTALTLTYNGQSQELVNPGATDDGTVWYSKDGGSSWSAAVPAETDAGDYTVHYKIVGDGNHNDNLGGSVGITIAKKPISAPAQSGTLTYDGTPQTPTWTSYSTAEITISVTPQTDADNNYTAAADLTSANYKWADGSTTQKTLTWAIGKANPTVTPPAGKALKYAAGQSQDLVTAGATNDGELQYCLTENGNYSATIPAATDAGEYNVYYKVAGDSNHNDTLPQFVVAVIGQGGIVYTAPTALNPVYNGTAQPLVTAGSAVGGTIQYSLNGTSSWSAAVPAATDAGNYAVYYKIAGDSNHANVAETLISAAIQKADAEFTRTPMALNPVYNGQPKGLVNSGTTDDGTVWYSKDGGSSWSAAIPAETDAGDYTVHYKIVGDGNHNDNAGGSVPAKIQKAAPTFTAPAALSPIYDGQPKALITSGSSADGTIEYKLAGGNWVSAVPAATNAGDYTVYYKITGDSNHTDHSADLIAAIGRATQPITISMGNFTYGNSPTVPQITGTKHESAAEIWEYSAGNTQNNWSAAKVLTAGTHGVRLTVQQTDNYLSGTVTSTYTVGKAIPSVTDIASVSGLEYNEQFQVLITQGSTTGGTLQYAFDPNGAWTDNYADMVKKTPGVYTVYYRVEGDANYEPVGTDSVYGAISQKTVILGVPAPKTGLVYDGTSKQLINEGTLSVTSAGVTIKYRVNGGEWLTAVPAAKNAGKYTVDYTVEITDNGYAVNNAAGTLSVSVSKLALAGIRAFMSGNTPYYVYNSINNEALPDGSNPVTYEYLFENTTNWTAQRAALGKYKIRAAVAESQNYAAYTQAQDINEYTNTVTITINVSKNISNPVDITVQLIPADTSSSGPSVTVTGQYATLTVQSSGVLKAGYTSGQHQYYLSAAVLDNVTVQDGNNDIDITDVNYGTASVSVYVYELYAITYEKNNSEASGTTPNAGFKLHGKTYNLALNRFTHVSKDPSGWNTSSAGTGTAYPSGGVYNVDAPQTFYAQYADKAITGYTVRWTAGTEFREAVYGVGGKILPPEIDWVYEATGLYVRAWNGYTVGVTANQDYTFTADLSDSDPIVFEFKDGTGKQLHKVTVADGAESYMALSGLTEQDYGEQDYFGWINENISTFLNGSGSYTFAYLPVLDGEEDNLKMTIGIIFIAFGVIGSVAVTFFFVPTLSHSKMRVHSRANKRTDKKIRRETAK